ncbi:MAG: 3-phosphoshikimate 1-carboxyvinyltransferase [Nautilia sp.]|nr:MAG: 3-phosphoshikimate 1-carboxyvinyltransferase [Nautilia sp.]
MIVKKLEKSFNIEIDEIASDKSISHRCAIFSLLSDRASIIKNYLPAEDTLNSLKIAELLGAKIEKNDEYIKITPPKKIIEPFEILDCGNSGTSIRIYSGLLAGIDGFFVLTGDKYLRKRPMKRVANPLTSIGAKIDGRDNGNLAPLAIRGGKLRAFNYESPIASAQVKSAMILAALNADDVSTYIEPSLSRDHTERMLKGMGAEIENEGLKIKITPLKSPLKPLEIRVPADPSSAFFFAIAAVITKSKVVLKNLTLNPTRIEAFKILEKMGAKIEYILKEDKYEPIGDIVIVGGELQAVEVSENIAWLIDEIPALAMAMAVAKGKSIVKNAKELRVKESDRIKAVVDNLNRCGIETKDFEDGFTISGGEPKFAKIDSFGDHRIAMSFAILGLVCGMQIDETDSIKTSFPNFVDILKRITEVDDAN